MAKGKVWYRYVGDAQGELIEGRTIGPGEYVELSGDEVNDIGVADLIVNGKLIEADEKLAKQAQEEEQATQTTEETGEEGS